MSKGFLVIVGLVLFAACSTQKKICPAYQSAFIFDQEAVRKKFSTFADDSTPKVYTASRNKFLIIPEESYRKKLKSLQTIEMKPVYTVLPDTSKSKKGRGEGDFYKAPDNIEELLRTQTRDLEPPPDIPKEIDSVEVKTDSVEVDSSYQISKDREVRFYRYHWDTLRRRTENLRGKRGEELSALYKRYQQSNDSAKYRVDNIRYSADQELYMWYLRDVLVLPDVRAAIEDEKRAKDTTRRVKNKQDTVKKVGFFKGLKGLFKKSPKDSTGKSTGGFFKRLKGLFKKKPKPDSATLVKPVPLSNEGKDPDFDFEDEVVKPVPPPPAPVPVVEKQEKRKKRKARKAEAKKEEELKKEKKKDPVKKEEDEEDGF
jgi:hypothetical protein